jgi:hypothetical protein
MKSLVQIAFKTKYAGNVPERMEELSAGGQYTTQFYFMQFPTVLRGIVSTKSMTKHTLKIFIASAINTANTGL